MKRRLLLLFLILPPSFLLAQRDMTWGYVSRKRADSLRAMVENLPNDTLKMSAYRSLGFYYQESKFDSSLYFHEKQLELAKKLNIKLWQSDAHAQIGQNLYYVGDVTNSYESLQEAIRIAEDERNEPSNWHVWTFSNAETLHDSRIAILAMNHLMLGNLYNILGEREKALSMWGEALKLGTLIHNPKISSLALGNMAQLYSPDSALVTLRKSLEVANSGGYKRFMGGILTNMGTIYYKKGSIDSAKHCAYRAVSVTRSQNNLLELIYAYDLLSFLYAIDNKMDSSLHYARKELETAKRSGSSGDLLSAYGKMSHAYKSKNKLDSAFKYERLSNFLNDSLKNYRIRKMSEYQSIAFNEQLRLKDLEKERKDFENKIRTNTLLGSLFTLLVIAGFLYRNSRQKQKAKQKIEHAYNQLKSTQSQLIQSEKMASLGELTAGIAHEIQNPLNFVNNFSEVSSELLDEMNANLASGNLQPAREIARDVKQNLEKILHHGKRADAIVKGMLQHSRSSSGVKEPTDINALADEYLRLAYHGLRAKDKSFNSKFETRFDENMGKVPVIPQEIGRVVLNLITNAFYAVTEKKKSGAANYEPTVTVSTRKEGNHVLISVKDNGSGIPQKVLDKIFQPFFTTKPTGQGTGLGLSMSYDIVKAHGGGIKVNTKENEGSEFVITLPC